MKWSIVHSLKQPCIHFSLDPLAAHCSSLTPISNCAAHLTHSCTLLASPALLPCSTIPRVWLVRSVQADERLDPSQPSQPPTSPPPLSLRTHPTPTRSIYFHPVDTTDFVLRYKATDFHVHRDTLMHTCTYLTEVMREPYAGRPVVVPNMCYSKVVRTPTHYGPWPIYGPPARIQSGVAATELDFAMFLAFLYWPRETSPTRCIIAVKTPAFHAMGDSPGSIYLHPITSYSGALSRVGSSFFAGVKWHIKWGMLSAEPIWLRIESLSFSLMDGLVFLWLLEWHNAPQYAIESLRSKVWKTETMETVLGAFTSAPRCLLSVDTLLFLGQLMGKQMIADKQTHETRQPGKPPPIICPCRFWTTRCALCRPPKRRAEILNGGRLPVARAMRFV